MAVVILATLVWSFIASHVAELALGIAPNIAADDFVQLFGAFRLRRQIEAAVQSAYDQFTNDLKRQAPELLAALERAKFGENPAVGAILGQAAMNPQEQHKQTQRLAEIMRQADPTNRAISATQRENAARALTRAVHQQISAIKELREGLILLETVRVRKWVERPPYTPGLMVSILDRADRLALELDHGYTSTGHLLDAIMLEPRSVAAWILGELTVSEKNVRAAIHAVVKPKPGLPPGARSAGVDKSLNNAPDLAAEQGALLTGTEHVLLALAKLAITDDEDGKAIRGIFGWLDIDPHLVYETAARVARGQSAVQSAIFSFSGAATPPPNDPHAAPGVIPPDVFTTMTTLGR